MISTCGIYSIKMAGAFNAPFVALDDNQAIDIVRQALDGSFDEGSICRLGTLDFYQGIIDANVTDVCDLCDITVSVQLEGDSSVSFTEEDVI